MYFIFQSQYNLKLVLKFLNAWYRQYSIFDEEIVKKCIISSGKTVKEIKSSIQPEAHFL